MTNWDRHKVMELADTIGHWLTHQAPAPSQRVELLQLKAMADQGSKTIETNARLLSDIRIRLCRVCVSEDCRLCAGQDNALYCSMVRGESSPS